MRRTGINTAVLWVACTAASLLAEPCEAAAPARVVDGLHVVVPFSGPTGWPPPAVMRFHVPAGTYYITLQVDRATWDHPGVADAVPLGIGAHGQDARRGVYNRQPWRTGLGFVATQVYVAEDSVLYVSFSTLAPLGARGILTIQEH